VAGEVDDLTDTVLMVALPEQFRDSAPTNVLARSLFIRAVEARLQRRFHRRSLLLDGGPAAVFGAFVVAQQLLNDDSTVRKCVIGGVDSLVNQFDIARLLSLGRIKNAANPQGLIPGEGASFLLVGGRRQRQSQAALGEVLGVGTGIEPNTVLGSRYSVGVGIRSALTSAVAAVGGGEASIDFVTSTFNGERYGAWEAMIARPRFYQTRRERLSIVYPAMSVGEIGTAAPALAVIAALTAIARGYAAGERAMCETYSDQGLRGACVIRGSPMSSG
jgi:3-oxoacyl-[acyl-carrier-protein] synthase-1